jgi:hypothetical protein
MYFDHALQWPGLDSHACSRTGKLTDLSQISWIYLRESAAFCTIVCTLHSSGQVAAHVLSAVALLMAVIVAVSSVCCKWPLYTHTRELPKVGIASHLPCLHARHACVPLGTPPSAAFSALCRRDRPCKIRSSLALEHHQEPAGVAVSHICPQGCAGCNMFSACNPRTTFQMQHYIISVCGC